MDLRLRQLTEKLDTRGPAGVEPLREAAAEAGVRLPDDYLEFMAEANGGSGDVGTAWIELWPTEEIVGAADDDSPYEGVFLFAGDGANTIYGFDSQADNEIVEGDWIGLPRDRLIRHGHSFTDFLTALADRK